MLVTSRSYQEYEAMFDLSELPGSVLDCCAGGSSFTAEAAARGVDAVAVDPAYELPAAELLESVRRSLPDGAQIVDQHAGSFVWTWYGDPGRRDEMRIEAADRFLQDVSVTPERYVAGGLPALPFEDGQFDLVLCSHLIFTWAGTYDRDWHLAALRELIRVSRDEVRIFPLVQQGAGEPVRYLPELLDALRPVRSEIRKVPYEFQAGADEMLVLTR
ncbi:class I SAM-dependent methyltransferase [Kribbella sp. CA-293567]|uniref:class I SAM-dependent methyltransferase n=1 Tax=Kribbella sp. CA-293567 TaxID=3002436 RepID=UPI0022DDE5FF|nr:methyltransferase domain-containing protein [Kribbella sp. CA-293567]WBQ06052.1 methyltransferase domain-containing protein [Kribbella sp. CA-293567]